MQEALSQACEKLTPVVRPVIVTCPFEGANLVFAVIDEMLPREKPCFVSSVGPHGGSYIRTGDGDRKMTAYESIVCLMSNASRSTTSRSCRRPRSTT